MKRPVPEGHMTSPPQSVSMPRIALAITSAKASPAGIWLPGSGDRSCVFIWSLAQPAGVFERRPVVT